VSTDAIATRWSVGGIGKAVQAFAGTVAVMVTVWLGSQGHIDHLSNDAAQYVSTARNLVRGEGLTTSIRYYEQQHRHANPAPQTSWPPLFPAVVAVAAAVGLAPQTGAWVIASLAFVGVALLSYRIARTCGAGAVSACAAAIVWLLSAEAWLSVVKGVSESLFILLTLLSALCVLRSADRSRQYAWLALAGLIGGAAFLARYAGVAFLPAGALVAAFMGLRTSWRDAFLRALTFSAPAAIVVALGFARNLALSDSLTGGPRIDAGTTLAGTVEPLEWSLRRLFVGTIENPAIEAALLALVAGTVVLAVAAFVTGGRMRRAPRNWSDSETVTVSWIALAAAYAGATLLLLAYVGMTTRPEIVTERYMLPFLPFVVVAIAVLADRGLAWRPGRLSRLAAGVALATAAIVGLAQIHTGRQALQVLRTSSDGVVIGSVLRSPADGERTVAEMIRAAVPPGASVLEANGQLVGLHLDLPSVGLPSVYYSRKVWDEPAVRDLVLQTGTAVLCIFPRLTVDPEINVNRVFIQSLIDGARPDWLQPLLQREDILLFRVTAAAPRSPRTDGEPAR
jgi:Dolichyl-phosphate-mannose-protein mannosyltransferase